MNPGTISGDAGRMLATFLGLVSASILPTISLMIGNMTTNGRSVLALDELRAELDSAMDALFLLFGCVGIVIAGLAALAIEPPASLHEIPYLTSDILPRSGQAIVVIAATLILSRAGQIPAILRRTLLIRHKIAVDEARKKTNENVPDPDMIKKAYSTHPDFGKVVKLEDVQRDTH
jgi:hypothetical protein